MMPRCYCVVELNLQDVSRIGALLACRPLLAHWGG